MARRKPNQPTGEIKLELGELYPKQWQFIESKTRYTAYGGARGGGKTHVLIRACIRGALQYPGIKILILRRTYPELEQTIIQPMNKLVNSATMDGRPCGDLIATYNGTMRMLFFANGSTVKFGHLQSAAAITEYQGQEYDWIFMDEATHFTEYEFRTMGATLRGVNEIPKHFYLTCNPGGVGHQWVKRLFVTREYEGVESGRDYSFIPATVEDNKELLKASPEYIQMLDTLPEDIRAAHRYGDWDAMAGQYFSEFRRERHVVKPFIVPKEWPRYRAFDYGLDMFACYWFAIDFDDRVWVYREYCESGLIVSEAAAAMRRLTPPGEQIQFTVAPPDMWSTQKDTGRTMAEIFMENGIGIVRASSQRVQGWMVVKEFLKERPDGRPGMLFTEDCPRMIRDLPALQHDEKNPSDCAKEPHEITHSPDALRYGLIDRMMGARLEPVRPERDDVDYVEEYDDYMTGGEAADGYLSYGG
ncbi:phage terminase large subunit [Flavonifractor plautii]|uniref:phage terminase large subunit n=1 Tax=Flavonifractor plautii TaxID=292800 RepID=UPI003EEDF84A